MQTPANPRPSWLSLRAIVLSAALLLSSAGARAEERPIGRLKETQTLVRQLQAIKAAPFTFRLGVTFFIDGVKTRSLDTELEMTIPGKIDVNAPGKISATLQFRQRGKVDPALPQSFTFRFAPDDYYTDASEESMGLVPMLVDVFFPSFLDAKEYPDAAWRDGMKKGAMIPALGLGGFPSLLGPLRLEEVDGEWAKCEARPGWEGAAPSRPLPDGLWEMINDKSPSHGMWQGKYVISMKTLLPRSADLTMEYVKPKDDQKSQVFHLKIDPIQ